MCICEDYWITSQFISEGDKVGFDDWQKYHQLKWFDHRKNALRLYNRYDDTMKLLELILSGNIKWRENTKIMCLKETEANKNQIVNII